MDQSGRKWIKLMKIFAPTHHYCHHRFATWLLAFLTFFSATAVQDCQAVSVLGLETGGNWTLETQAGGNESKEETFEKFYGCYFDKFFRNSDPPIPLQQFVQQSVEVSMGSDEKVKVKKVSK